MNEKVNVLGREIGKFLTSDNLNENYINIQPGLRKKSRSQDMNEHRIYMIVTSW